MEIQALKIFNPIKLILFLILVLGVITVLTACGDLVKESDTGACDNAIDARNYETAISVCTSRKDIASAYMGLAGYDIINLLKSSGTTVSKYTEPTALGTDDVAGASILNILQLSVAVIDNDTNRAAAIASSRTNLDNASALLQPHLSELSTDEILLNTFAISFAMQLNQLQLYDNATTTAEAFPSLCDGCNDVDNLTCAQIDISNSDVKANLKAMDGHLWTKERNGTQCKSILGAINGLSGDAQATAFTNFNAWVDNASRGKLPEPFATSVCGPISPLINYLSDLTLNLTELKKAISLSGDNTKTITNADNSTNTMLKAIGCLE